MSIEEETKLPTLSQKIKPLRGNARESVEINAKIFELVVGQMNNKVHVERKGRRALSLRDRLKKRKKKMDEDEEESKSDEESLEKIQEENDKKEEDDIIDDKKVEEKKEEEVKIKD